MDSPVTIERTEQIHTEIPAQEVPGQAQQSPAMSTHMSRMIRVIRAQSWRDFVVLARHFQCRVTPHVSRVTAASAPP